MKFKGKKNILERMSGVFGVPVTFPPVKGTQPDTTRRVPPQNAPHKGK